MTLSDVLSCWKCFPWLILNVWFGRKLLSFDLLSPILRSTASVIKDCQSTWSDTVWLNFSVLLSSIITIRGKPLARSDYCIWSEFIFVQDVLITRYKLISPSLEPILSTLRNKAGECTPVYHRVLCTHTFTPKGDLTYYICLHACFLDSGRGNRKEHMTFCTGNNTYHYATTMPLSKKEAVKLYFLVVFGWLMSYWWWDESFSLGLSQVVLTAPICCDVWWVA